MTPWRAWSLVFPIFYDSKDEDEFSIVLASIVSSEMTDMVPWFHSKFWNSHCAFLYYIIVSYEFVLWLIFQPLKLFILLRKSPVLSNCPHNLWFLRFSWGVLRTLGKLLSTSALHQECHTATPSLTFAQREGSLRRQEVGGTAGASRSKEPQPCKSMSFCSNQLYITVLGYQSCNVLHVRISSYYQILDQSNFALNFLRREIFVCQPVMKILSYHCCWCQQYEKV